jgi:hypothetical protein
MAQVVAVAADKQVPELELVQQVDQESSSCALQQFQ